MHLVFRLERCYGGKRSTLSRVALAIQKKFCTGKYIRGNLRWEKPAGEQDSLWVEELVDK